MHCASSEDSTNHAVSKIGVRSDNALAVDRTGDTCFHRATRFLDWLLEETDDDRFEKPKVGRQYIVRTATMKIQVGCYNTETISDLMARVVQLASGVERQNLGKGALCVWTAAGDLMAPNTTLGDLPPDVELVLGQTLCEATIAECSDDAVKVACTSATSTTASYNDDLEDIATPDGFAVAGPSAFFINEPHLGPCVLLKDGDGSSEQLVCTMAFSRLCSSW